MFKLLNIIILFVLCSLLSVTVGQIVQNGQCDPNIEIVANFDIQAFLGTWHEIQRTESPEQQTECPAFQFTFSNNVINVEHNGVKNNMKKTTSGTAQLISDNARLVLDIPMFKNPIDFWVLTTDYVNFAVTYSCENISPTQRKIYVWVLGRQTGFSSELMQAYISIVLNNVLGVQSNALQTVGRSARDCYVLNPAENVIFRGQCDRNIYTMMNFDERPYAGLWHVIESYSAPFLSGTCKTAFYLPVDGITQVVNTQVINENLESITGTMVRVSTDHSAKFNMTFIIEGIEVTVDYWVLATDYIDYSLVYSCQNIGDEYMAIYSWKLGRMKTLSQWSNVQINQILDSLNTLDQRYYMKEDQSDAACFYLPEPEPGTPVEFRGQCDAFVPVVQHFDYGQFEGLWHEIESYPYKGTGQCISHQFSYAGDSFYHIDTFRVMNQVLWSSKGTAIGGSTDGSAMLHVTIRIEGDAYTIPVWILDTDYTNYALAYSCVNINYDRRRVYSWKLSRSKSLSLADIAAINNGMSNMNVLDNMYFERISQSDEACFYLPNLSPSEPAIFPGQCSENIPVISNFDVNRYLGRWKVIETYHFDSERGDCIEQNYFIESMRFNVIVISDVRYQQLNSTTGSFVAAADGSGRYIVSFRGGEYPRDYWVLDTDYSSYALLYSCENISDEHRRVWSWKMSRTNTLTSAANAAMKGIIDKIDVLNERYYKSIDHSVEGCFYYPTPEENDIVLFPGQCDTNIPAFPNFVPENYLGLWYEVEAYPEPHQRGTCSRAEYSLSGEKVLNVKRTQVIDRQLVTQIGRVNLTTTDGTAKFDVTFNVNGYNVTYNYWILDTDYMSYALVYSCFNMDPYTRAVFSWKLSRTPQLTQVAAFAIDAVISTVNVLDHRYYLTNNHTEEACAHYSDDLQGDEVLFSGSCGNFNEVPTVTNFNPIFFTGTWHEISRYSGIQEGECVSTQYLFMGTNNEFMVTHNTVIDQTLVINTTGAIVPDLQRGILNVNGAPFKRLFILATDYNDYALAFACRNVNSRQKQLFSWKLSRSRSGLSATANAVMDQIIKENEYLWEQFYRTTRQDDDACFVKPEIEPKPEDIILPGPCRSNIQGVNNFNVQAFLGLWFETARYPTPEQIGQCGRVQYRLSNQFIVTVSEVARQTLRTQSGFVGISNDGTGMLNLVFTGNGAPRSAIQYILATDYNSYALAYSCTNTPDGNRRVSSWKLSRTPTLSPEAAAAMAPVIANTLELFEPYYQPTSQTSEDCFYIPTAKNETLGDEIEFEADVIRHRHSVDKESNAGDAATE